MVRGPMVRLGEVYVCAFRGMLVPSTTTTRHPEAAMEPLTITLLALAPSIALLLAGTGLAAFRTVRDRTRGRSAAGTVGA